MSESTNREFWLTKPLKDLSLQEWESLCDGCGKCCLNKIEDEDTKEIFHTTAACKWLSLESCKCTNYKKRRSVVPDCKQLTWKNLKNFNWLPKSCSYVLVADGKDLPDWHHLKSGNRETIHKVGASVKGRVTCESKVKNLSSFVANWPGH